jgi:hypothetical protein
MRVNTDKTVFRVVTIAYALFLFSVLMSGAEDGQSPSYSLIVKVIMTIAVSAIMGAAAVLFWNKLRFR